ncbi:MAG: SurA N-terminal domain-containing protein [Deltaproteobacteria bacterium]|nr:SurA N-terminal domain-containing protein [Deltaproteobacteria bacterium]
MLEALRNKRNSAIVLFIFAAIVIVFIFWGVSPSGNDKQDRAVVATVDNVSILSKDYISLYKRQVEYYKEQSRGQLTDEMLEKMNLKRMALDLLINRNIAFKEAASKGISVADKDVQDVIKGIPAFAKDNAFNKETYLSVLSANRLKPAEFEANIREDIMLRRVQEAVVKDVTVSDDEAKAGYIKENRQISLEFVTFDPARYLSSINISEDEAKEYLKKNGSRFMEPLRVDVFYAAADFNSLASIASRNVSAKEIKDFYEKNPKQFELPEEIAGRHILIRPEPKATDKAVALQEARKKAEAVLVEVKAGGDFSALAKKYSQDPGSAKQGGDLGWFQKGTMVKAFEDAAFALAKDEVSGLVETPYGFHIIKVYGKKEAAAAPLKDVEGTIRNIIAKQKAWNEAKEQMTALETVFKNAKTGEELKKAVSSRKGITHGSTGLVSERDKSELAKAPEVQATAFALADNEVSRVIQTQSAFYLLKATKRVTAHVPDYPAIAVKVKDALRRDKAMALASSKADEVLKKTTDGEDLAKAAKTEGVRIESTPLFALPDGRIPVIGAQTGDKPELFGLEKTAPYHKKVVEAGGKFYVLKFKAAKEADAAGFDKIKEQYKSSLISRKQEETLNKWVAALRANAKIKIFEERL